MIIRCDLVGNKLALGATAYNEDLRVFCKGLEGRLWDGERREWMVPLRHLETVLAKYPWGQNGFQITGTVLAYADRKRKEQAQEAERLAVTRKLLEATDAQIDYRLLTDPYPFQRVMIRAMYENAYWGNFGDLGTGKSLTTLAVLDWLRREGTIDLALLVCPTSLMRAWVRDQIKVHAPNLSYMIVDGNQERRQKLYALDSIPHVEQVPFLVIVSYGVLYADRQALIELVNRYKTAMILDESSNIMHQPKKKKLKEPEIDPVSGLEIKWKQEGLRSFAAVEIGHQPGVVRRYALNGAPITNHLEEIWHQCYWLDEGRTFGKSYWDFVRDYCVTEKTKYSRYKITGYKKDAIKEKLRTISYRLTKEEAVDLPPVQFENVYTRMTDDQQAIYDTARKKLKVEIHEMGETYIKKLKYIIDKMGYLLRIAANPRLLGHNKRGGKQFEIVELLERVLADPDRKVVVWSNYTEDLDELMTLTKGYNPVLYSGIVSPKNRDEAIERHRHDLTCRVMNANPQAGGMGLNLTHCDVQIWMNRTFDAKFYRQGVGRLHRIGQTKKVTVFNLIMENSIDEYVDSMTEDKIEAARDLLGDAERGAITKKDLMLMLGE